MMRALFALLLAGCSLSISPGDCVDINSSKYGDTRVCLQSSVDAGTPVAPCSPDGGACAASILWIGDSLTMGVTYLPDGTYVPELGGFRAVVYRAALARGVTLRMLGTQANGPPDIDRHHEGHSGFEIGTPASNAAISMMPNIASWCSLAIAQNGGRFPDYVMLMGGTNEINHGLDEPTAIARLTAALPEIHAWCGPGVVFFLAPPPMLHQPPYTDRDAAIRQFRYDAPTVVAMYPWARFVDVYDYVSPSAGLCVDGVHCSPEGYDSGAVPIEAALFHELGLQ